jgi:hypothetical protein
MGVRTRTDKICVGAGGDIGGTDISCNFMARQYTGPTGQSYRDDQGHVGVMQAAHSINTPAWCVEQVSPRLPHDVASLEKIRACSLVCSIVMSSKYDRVTLIKLVEFVRQMLPRITVFWLWR